MERVCDLSLVGLGRGGVEVYFDLAGQHSRLCEEADRRLLFDGVTLLFDGLEWAAGEDEVLPVSLERLKPSSRLAVLGVVVRLLPTQSGVVERIIYRHRGFRPTMQPRCVRLTRSSRQRVHREMERLVGEGKFTEAEGVIRQVDLDAQTFVLRDRPVGEPDLFCEYPGPLADAVRELITRRVRVSGLLETSRVTQRTRLEAEAIEPLGEGEESRATEGSRLAGDAILADPGA